MVRPTKEEGAKIRAAAKAAEMSVQGYILQAVREYMEHTGQPDTPQEPPQSTTGAASISPDTATPPQVGTPTGEQTRPGVVLGFVAGSQDGSMEVTPSPTHDPQKSLSEDPLADLGDD